MNSLQDLCINTIVKNGHPKLLSPGMHPVLYNRLTDKIGEYYFDNWSLNINLIHLDLLLTLKNITLEIITCYGELEFLYFTGDEIIQLTEENCEYLDPWARLLFDNTIKYLKTKNLYGQIEERLEMGRNLTKRRRLAMR
jgi:hypothetical protein